MENKKHVDYVTIKKASNGDGDALKIILDFYKPYIKSLATMECVSDTGKKYWVVDDEAENRMRMRLIIRVLKFNPVPVKRRNKNGK